MTDGKILTLEAHGRSYDLWTWPGKIRKCMEAGIPYEKSLLESVYKAGFKGRAIDGGANLGNHSMWFARICGLLVEAFEPVWPGHLLSNVERNDMHDFVKVHPCGLSDAQGVGEHVGKGRLASGKGALELQPLDSFEFDGVVLIKLDIEGMEPAALRGAEHTIRTQRPVLYIEAWGQPEHDAHEAILSKWGYRVTGEYRHSKGSTLMVKWEHA